MKWKKKKMALKGPRGAVPSPRGWMNPNTNEILSVRKFTQAEIDEWHGVDTSNPEPTVEMLVEAPRNNTSLEEMTKTELEALGMEHGVDLDRRYSKKKLINTLKVLGAD